MPNYNFRDETTGNEWTDFMSNSEREIFLEKNPNISQIFTSPISLGDPIALGIRKPDKSFRDVLKEVKKHHPLSNGINLR